MSINVELGKTYDLVILLNNKDSAFTRIVTHPEAVSFDKDYIQKYNHQTTIEIPEVYELVNVIIALTNRGIQDSDLVIHNTDYYKSMIQWFQKFSNDKIVLTFDSCLKANFWNYFNLKMDAYSIEFNKEKLVRSKIYDRVSWGSKNSLWPFIHDLQNFSRRTNFRTFYRTHRNFYASQISYYRDSLNLKEMQQWLNRNFPSTSYNCIKVIFSPLVGYSQSANWFENNGFKEAQAHVNFPYSDVSDKNYSSTSNQLRNESVVFTEINHAFINPEADKYSNTSNFKFAFSNLKFWEAENSPATDGYPNANSCFNEYMNWALVSLRYVDLAPKNELESLLRGLEKNQKNNRGFIKFPEFNRNLIKLYQERKKGETIADLYPAIIQWCKDQIK